MGWAEPGPTTWVGLALPAHYNGPPLFTCNVNSGEANTEGEEGGRGGEGRRLT